MPKTMENNQPANTTKYVAGQLKAWYHHQLFCKQKIN